MKNVIYAVIIVVCLTVAGAVVLVTRSADKNLGISDAVQTWVKCLSCGDSHQMGLKSLWKQQRAKMFAKGKVAASPLLTCPKCGKDAVVEAFKCPKCGEVSRKGCIAPGDYDDRCPKCNFSQIEADRKAKAAAEAH